MDPLKAHATALDAMFKALEPRCRVCDANPCECATCSSCEERMHRDACPECECGERRFCDACRVYRAAHEEDERREADHERWAQERDYERRRMYR